MRLLIFKTWHVYQVTASRLYQEIAKVNIVFVLISNGGYVLNGIMIRKVHLMLKYLIIIKK